MGESVAFVRKGKKKKTLNCASEAKTIMIKLMNVKFVMTMGMNFLK